MSDEQEMKDHEEETIHVEDESTGEQTWTEEFTVAGSKLVETIEKLVHEASVRRIVVKNEARNFHIEVPILVGVGAIALLPAYAALALIAALVADCKILVERVVVEKEPEAADAEAA